MDPLSIDRSPKEGDNYLTRLQKMIPVEVTGLYFFLSKLANDFKLVFFIFVVLVILIMYFLYLPRRQMVIVKWHRLVIIISFIVWAINIDLTLFRSSLDGMFTYLQIPTKFFFLLELFQAGPLAMMLAVWTFFVPLIYRAPSATEALP